MGFEGRVIELSWYGDRPVTLDLGAAFHYGRKRIIGSQVSTVAPAKRATHDFGDRLAAVVELLADERLDALCARPIPFDEMPDFMNELYDGCNAHPHPVVGYNGRSPI